MPAAALRRAGPAPATRDRGAWNLRRRIRDTPARAPRRERGAQAGARFRGDCRSLHAVSARTDLVPLSKAHRLAARWNSREIDWLSDGGAGQAPIAGRRPPHEHLDSGAVL